ncbi:MAG: DNA repair protein RadC [Eubacterium sp.]|nr:DNA repair protein RadC [Eubacterium sp.]
MEHTTQIQSIPAEDRPYERCLRCGPEVLSDTELLAVILRTGVKGISALELAGQVLRLCPSEPGLLGLYHLSAEELRSIHGIGTVKALQILCIGELSRRIAKCRRKDRMPFREPGAVASYYMEELRHEEKERVICMMLDTRNRLLADVEISRGTVNASMLSPREIFLSALTHRAVQIILVHNHPSGDTTPSQADRVVTRDTVLAGEVLGISLLDHIIIGDGSYTSLREADALLFEQADGRRYTI